MEGDARSVDFVPRYAVVSDERVGVNEYLAEVRGVGEGLRITRHSRREDDLALDAFGRAKRPAFVHGSVFENKPCRISSSVQDSSLRSRIMSRGDRFQGVFVNICL
jgi:hypothetical protein